MAKKQYEKDTIKFLHDAYLWAERIGLKYINNEVVLGLMFDNQELKITKFFAGKGITEEDLKKCFEKVNQDFRNSKDVNPLFFVPFNVYLGQNVSITCNSEFQQLLTFASSVAEKIDYDISVELIMYSYFLSAEMPNTMKRLLKYAGISEKEARNEFLITDFMDENFVPKNINSFVYSIDTKKYLGKKKTILGRDKEVARTWDVLSKQQKSNVVLLGEAGVGKSAIFEEITREVVNNDGCPKKFADYHLVILDVGALVAGTKYVGMAEERFINFINFLEKNPKVIVFIDEMHTMLGAGKAEGASMDIANALKEKLARSTTKVIGATTKDEFKNIIEAYDPAFARRFEQITVNEPNLEETYKMVQKVKENLCTFHNVELSNELLKMIIIGSAFKDSKKHNPDRTIDAIDIILTSAKVEKKTKVTKKMILAEFGVFSKYYREIPKEEKMIVSCKIAAKYLFAKQSEKLSGEIEVIGLSTIITSKKTGAIITQKRKDAMHIDTRRYFVDSIAIKVAGIEAEKKQGDGILTDYEELKHITETAENVVKEYGLFDNPNDNRVFLEKGKDETNKNKIFINEQIDKLISDATKVAEDFVENNWDEIIRVAEILNRKSFIPQEEFSILS